MNFLERLLKKAMVKAVERSKGVGLPVDGKTDYVTFSDEKIAEFAERMNRAAKE